MFDDSIAQDDEAIKTELLELVDKSMIPNYYSLAFILKITEDEAKLLVAEALEEQAKANKLFQEQYEDDTPEDDEDEPEDDEDEPPIEDEDE